MEESTVQLTTAAKPEAVEVQRVKALQGITYAEAVKKVSREKIVYKSTNKETKEANVETKDIPCGGCGNMVAKLII